MFFNKSTQATSKLKRAQRLLVGINDEDDGDDAGGGDGTVRSVILLQDVVTRWWSTHRMIKRLLELKDPLILCFNQNGVCNVNADKKKNCEWELTPQQWTTLERIVEVLEPFEDGMKLLEGEKYVTASWVLIVVELIRKGIQKGMESNCITVVRMSTILLKDFEKRWGVGGEPVFNEIVVRGFMNRQLGVHPCFVIAMCLDPRFKHLKKGGVRDDEVHSIWNKVLQLMIEERRSANGDDGDVESDFEYDDEPVPPPVDGNDDNLDFLTQLDCVVVGDNNVGTNNSNNDAGVENDAANRVRSECEVELSLYRNAQVLKVRNNSNHWSNPLEWWKKNEMKFPALAALAKKYLSVQATSASSERIFSRARRIVTTDRNRLDPQIVGCLLYISENLNWYEKMSVELNYDEVADQFLRMTINDENEEAE